MSKLRILSSLGDRTVVWDQRKADQGEREAIAAVAEAERIFAENAAKGAVAFKVMGPEASERIDRFDASAEQIVIVPRLAGG